MIKYNLKKILIEEDELDLVDPFYTKYDEVPTSAHEWWDYRDDLKKHIKSQLTDYVKNNPDVTSAYSKVFPGDPRWMVVSYIRDWPAHRGYYGDHIENSRADTWIEDFHKWLENM